MGWGQSINGDLDHDSIAANGSRNLSMVSRIILSSLDGNHGVVSAGGNFMLPN